MVRVMALVAIIFACGMPAGHAAEAIDVTGTGWIGRAKDGSIARLMEFRKNGIFVEMTDQHIYTGIWKYEQGKVGAAVKYREYVTSGGIQGTEYIMSLAEVEDGKLKGASFHYDSRKKQKFWEIPFQMEPETTCKGERGICGDRLYCIDPATRKSVTPIPFLDGPAAEDKRKGERADDVLKAFACAARLNITGTLAPRVRFPLTYVEIDRISSPEKGDKRNGQGLAQRQVQASEFPGIAIWPTEREKERAMMESRTYDSGPKMDAHGEHRFLLPPFPPRTGKSMLNPWPGGATLWHFSDADGAWYLDEIWECHGLRCPESLYCGDEQPRALFPVNKAGQTEDFFDFFRTYYCAIHAGNRDLVFSRIRFPLPYELYHTEGEEKGIFRTPGKLELGRLYACDGRTMPPSMTVKGDTASVSLQFDGTGCGKTLFFKNVKGNWHLVKIHFGEY